MAARRGKSKKGPSKADREFISEAEEILEAMSSDLSDLREQAQAGTVDPELVNGVFRSAHSLKGLAGMFGLSGIGDLAHHMEDVLDALRLGRLPLDSPVLSLLDEAVALFVAMLGKLGDPARASKFETEVAELVARIEAATEAPPVDADDLSGLSLDASLLRALTEYEEHRLRENLRLARHLSLVDATFDILSFEEGLGELTRALREVGEVVSTLPSPGNAPDSQSRFSLLVATEIAAAQLGARLEMPDLQVRVVTEGPAAAPPAESPAPSAAAPRQPAATAPESAPAEAVEFESLRSISETVRVDVRKLDELMNLVGELVIRRAAIAEIGDRLCGDPATSRIGSELLEHYKQLDRKLKELQAGVLDVRMVPMRQVFEKLSRVGRRLRRDLGKDVDLEFSGGDTELDKLIVEQLVDPLMHLLRNSFDHAIEDPEERERLGKPRSGTIHVGASQRGNNVVVEIHDDGRGIDPVAVRAEAEAKGLITPETPLSSKETLDLVFSPGFSTRRDVSETSGRGVGMDVVRSNIMLLGGVVDLNSQCGRGSVVTLTLPITLAIIQALIVGVGAQRFAIPLSSVLETLLVEAADIQRSEERELLNLRGEALQLRRLADEFEIPSDAADGKQFAVVLGIGEQRIGLLVDRLEGQQDTVIKPIRGPIQQVPGIAGATQLGAQGTVLVLDVASIVEDSLRRRDAA